MFVGDGCYLSCLSFRGDMQRDNKALNSAHFHELCSKNCRSQWPLGLRRGSAAVRLLGLWVRITLGARTSVCCECCVLSGRGPCVGLIPPLEESYRVWCVECG
jgi:hypothetical protein